MGTRSSVTIVGACIAALLGLAFDPSVGRQETTTMKAVRYHAFGGPEVLRYEDAPRPVPKAGEVLVRVYAAGVNPVDWKLRQGGFKQPGQSFPQIPGFDLAGTVEAVGAGVERFQPGDSVFGYLSLRRGGAYAEFALAAEGELARMPDQDFVGAAAVPLAALTAWQALFDTAGLEEGQTVLVHAGAGGVGHFAVQLANSRGARVIATASQKNHEFLKRLGADQTIDYKTQRFEELVHDVDVVLDSIGGDTRTRSYEVLKKGGFLVSIVGAPAPAELEAHGLRGAGILVKPDAKQLEEIAALIEAGRLVPEVSEVLPLAEAARAHELSQGGHTRGKIVLEVRP